MITSFDGKDKWVCFIPELFFIVCGHYYIYSFQIKAFTILMILSSFAKVSLSHGLYAFFIAKHMSPFFFFFKAINSMKSVVITFTYTLYAYFIYASKNLKAIELKYV